MISTNLTKPRSERSISWNVKQPINCIHLVVDVCYASFNSCIHFFSPSMKGVAELNRLGHRWSAGLWLRTWWSKPGTVPWWCWPSAERGIRTRSRSSRAAKGLTHASSSNGEIPSQNSSSTIMSASKRVYLFEIYASWKACILKWKHLELKVSWNACFLKRIYLKMQACMHACIHASWKTMKCVQMCDLLAPNALRFVVRHWAGANGRQDLPSQLQEYV